MPRTVEAEGRASEADEPQRRSVSSPDKPIDVLEPELHQALSRRQLFPVYQPQIDLSTGKLVGFEALLRWRRASGELIPPMRFIPLMEELDLIHDVGIWILEQACTQAAAWHAGGMDGFRMSVNVSPRQLVRSDLVARVAAVLERTGLSPDKVILELTEGILVEDSERTLRSLRGLHEMGLAIALDDFGTGYSSLGYLKRYPVDTLKIDYTFMPEVLSDPAAASIVRSIVSLGQSLGLEVVAEGVESTGQMAFLQRLGCHAAQGFYIGAPQPASEIEPWLARHQRWCQDNHWLFAGSAGHGGPGAQAAKPRTVLVVEDDAEDRHELGRILAERSMDVILASDCGEARQALETRASHISLVLTDISLPDGQGLDLLRQARRLPRVPSFIIMTGHGTMEHAIIALKEGAADFLTKPFTSRDLDEALERAFRQSPHASDEPALAARRL